MRCETLTFLSPFTCTNKNGCTTPAKAITYLVPVPGFDIEKIAERLKKLLVCRDWVFADEREVVETDPWLLPRYREIAGTMCELRFLNPEVIALLDMLD